MTDTLDYCTFGGLDKGRGSGPKILLFTGELTGLDDGGTYTISGDGAFTVTASEGGAAADLVVTHGAGEIVVTNYDANGTGAGIEGSVGELEFRFGDTDLTAANSLDIFGAVANIAYDIGGGTVGSAAVDALGFASLVSITGNKVKFALSAPYENEGGTQIDIAADTIVKFTIMAFAAPGGIQG